jgi:hypothetical protein
MFLFEVVHYFVDIHFIKIFSSYFIILKSQSNQFQKRKLARGSLQLAIIIESLPTAFCQLPTSFSVNNMDSNLAPVLLIKNDLTHTVGSGVSLPGCQQAERIK